MCMTCRKLRVGGALLRLLTRAHRLLALGASRELLGHGSLGAGLDDVLGPAWARTRIDVFPERHGLLLVLLPPGAFILLGLMLAIRNRLAQRRQVQRGAAIAVAESRA